MAQTTGTFSQLADNTDRLIYVMLDQELKRLDPIWRKIFNIKKSNRQTEISLGVVGFGDTPEKGEGAPFAEAQLTAGHTKTVSHTEFGHAFVVTETALEDDLYGQLKKHAMWFMFAAKYTQEKRAANIFNNGFTSERTADGVSLFNTAHPLAGSGAGTARNQPSTDVALSWNALRDAIVDFATETKHDSGQIAMAVEDLYLYVPPALEMLADRLVNSSGLPTSADNDRNAINARRNITVLTNPLLTDTNAWFLLAKNKDLHGITAYERVPITIGQTRTDPKTNNKLTPVRFRTSWFAETWQNAWGTAGA